MLKKLVNWCNKIIPAIGASMLAVGLVIIIALAVMPHGTTYTYELDSIYKVEFIFDDDDEFIFEQTSGSNFTSTEYECRINDGKLFTYDRTSRTWNYEGTINAYQIDLATEAMGVDIVLECKTSYALRTLSIVLMVVGGVVALAAVAVAILNKKGYIKLEKAVAAEAQVVEPAQEPQVQAEPVAEETVAAEPVEETKAE